MGIGGHQGWGLAACIPAASTGWGKRRDLWPGEAEKRPGPSSPVRRRRKSSTPRSSAGWRRTRCWQCPVRSLVRPGGCSGTTLPGPSWRCSRVSRRRRRTTAGRVTRTGTCDAAGGGRSSAGRPRTTPRRSRTCSRGTSPWRCWSSFLGVLHDQQKQRIQWRASVSVVSKQGDANVPARSGTSQWLAVSATTLWMLELQLRSRRASLSLFPPPLPLPPFCFV